MQVPLHLCSLSIHFICTWWQKKKRWNFVVWAYTKSMIATTSEMDAKDSCCLPPPFQVHTWPCEALCQISPQVSYKPFQLIAFYLLNNLSGTSCCIHIHLWRRYILLNIMVAVWVCRSSNMTRISQNHRGYLRKQLTNTRLVCTHLNTFFMLNPNVAMTIWKYIFWKKKVSKFDFSFVLDTHG